MTVIGGRHAPMEAPLSPSNEPDTQIPENEPLIRAVDLSARRNGPSHYRHKTSSSDSETLDKNYTVRNTDYKRFFGVGRVFSTLWVEPMGGASSGRENSGTEFVFGDKGNVHYTIRRFVVVRQHDRFCTCLPVTSYTSGNKKTTSKLSDQGLIYTQSPPSNVEGISRTAIRVTIGKGAGTLRDPSVVNYARVSTVEMNLKVRDIGELDPNSVPLLQKNFHDVILGMDNETSTQADVSQILPPPTTMATSQAIQQRETVRHECSYTDCNSSFSRRQELERHKIECHGPPQHCPVLGCGYQVQRKSRLRNHLQKEHDYSHQASVMAVSGDDPSTTQAGQTLSSSGHASQTMAYNPSYPTTSNSTPSFSQPQPNAPYDSLNTVVFPTEHEPYQPANFVISPGMTYPAVFQGAAADSVEISPSIQISTQLSGLCLNSGFENSGLSTTAPSQLDQRYSVVAKPTRFFKIGRVLKTLWTEPAGSTTKALDPAFYSKVGYDELVFSKVRRFVVIRERTHSCLCLPLYTYGGQGTTKSDVRAQDHAVAYALGSRVPPLTSDEELLDKDPFAIVVEDPTERIDPMTRINFAQVYTIQHNVKVAKVGRVSKDQLDRLDTYFIESISAT